jgi:hypothetical protein
VWRPKVISKYTPEEYANDIDDGFFDYEVYGRAVFRPKTRWTPGTRSDIIEFVAERHTEELMKNLKVGEHVDSETKEKIISIIQKYWDCFCAEGARRPILGYEFGIDTGSAKPVCCRKKQYGPYESSIIMKQVKSLLDNDWIYECEGPWGSLIVLAPKPHQEHIDDINKFIWRMCVSYRQLNAITKPFEYPIPRCDDAITILIVGGKAIYIITVDARQGYHQVAVRLLDQEKLAFFAPDNKKYTWKVMPFGPTNAPAFYTAMMGAFQGEWDKLFSQKLEELQTVGVETVCINSDNSITVGGKTVSTGSKVIIDDILVWSNNLDLVLLYFECVCCVFRKYRVSFRLDKCEFLKNRVEYVGHDLTPTGNCPAKSKFNLITDWKLPTTGQALHSFVGLVNYYAKYCPFFEIKLKPMRKMIRDWYRSNIPLMAWSPSLIALFEELKKDITSSPVLARFDPSQPTFLKTDWSANGMGWILMQPAMDEDSQRAVKELKDTGECKFDLSIKGPRLNPVAYGSRGCSDMERLFHSFVGEAACGRWAISQNRKFLWGNHFYWMCDCKAIREILEYDGTIAMISRWAQELLGYHFTVVHRSARMMVDVDGLTRRFGPSVAEYIMIAKLLSDEDKQRRPSAYAADFNSIDKPTKVYQKKEAAPQHDLILTHQSVRKITDAATVAPDPSSAPVHLHTSPVIMTTNIQEPKIEEHIETQIANKDSVMWKSIEAMEIVIVCLDDVTGSVLDWSLRHAPQQFIWSVINVFTKASSASIFRTLFTSPTAYHGTLSLNTNIEADYLRMHRFEASFIPHESGSIIEWINNVLAWINKIIINPLSDLRQATLWIRSDFFQQPVESACMHVIDSFRTEDWVYTIRRYNAAQFGDCIMAERIGIHVHQEVDAPSYATTLQPTELHQFSASYGQHIVTELNNTLDTDVVQLPFELVKKAPPQDAGRHLPYPICTTKSQATTGYSNEVAILDPEFPGTEPRRLGSQHSIFGNRFGIPFQGADNTWYSRSISTLELFKLYSIPEDLLHNPKVYLSMHHEADCLLPSSVPYSFRQAFMESNIICHALTDPFVFSEDAHVNGIQCFFTSSKPPPTLNWNAAYKEDNDIQTIFELLRSFQHSSIPEKEIRKVHRGYREHLRRNRMRVMNERLVILKPILMDKKHITLIVVPTGLRKQLFSHFHAGPSGGHMGEYKTLFRMRLRFFWPKMRTDIKDWTIGCAHCQAYNIWRSRKSELYFSWPVTIPFYIMHVDLWSPGHTNNAAISTSTYSKEQNGYLLNSMCDLTQFVISTVTYNTTALELSQLFMSNVVLSFGMCAVIVVDEGSNFKGVFQEMCSILKITCWPLARGNHKGLSVERYHRFLNKTQAIAGNDRGTHETFVQNSKTSQYAWNSAPIDGTDITRSMVAVGRDFRFPLDVELSAPPTRNDSSNSALYDYLRHVSNDSTFAQSVVQILIEERREEFRIRHNKGKTLPQFKVGDVVKAHVQVKSNKASGEVEKLSYRARGPFQIVKCNGHNSYEVKRYNEPNSASRKYKATELYLLPPTIFPAEPLDTMDQRFLNYENAPIVSPLKKAMKVELYNEQFFGTPPAKSQPSKDAFSTTIDAKASEPHQLSIPTMAEMHQELGTSPPEPETNESPENLDTDNNYTPATLFTKLTDNTREQLFFIQYTPENTLRPRWYLVEVDLQATKDLNAQYQTNGKYYCSFLAKHRSDNSKSDEFSRWWNDWYTYHRCKETDVIIYDKRVAIPPNQTPDSSKYIEWADLVDLTAPNTILHGPFGFQPLSDSNRTRSTVAKSNWIKLQRKCLENNILPPTLGSTITLKPTIKKSNKRKAP